MKSKQIFENFLQWYEYIYNKYVYMINVPTKNETVKTTGNS